jgi:hypothetical protein
MKSGKNLQPWTDTLSKKFECILSEQRGISLSGNVKPDSSTINLQRAIPDYFTISPVNKWSATFIYIIIPLTCLSFPGSDIPKHDEYDMARKFLSITFQVQYVCSLFVAYCLKKCKLVTIIVQFEKTDF